MKYLGFADLHLSDSPPRCRRDESNWLSVQERVLNEIVSIAKEERVDAFLFAGDFFDRPRVSPSVERLAINTVKQSGKLWMVVPGQHDLPGHRIDNVDSSSFGVMLSACENFICDNEVGIYHVPWGAEISDRRYWDIALLHKMVWKGDPPFPGASVTGNVNNVLAEFNNTKGIILSGDNHVPFEHTNEYGTLINCGSVMRRTIDQVDYRPSVVIIDGMHFKRVYLDTTKDVFTIQDNLKTVKAGEDISAELDEFIGLLVKHESGHELSFGAALELIYNQEMTPKEIQEFILRKRSLDK